MGRVVGLGREVEMAGVSAEGKVGSAGMRYLSWLGCSVMVRPLLPC